MWGFKHQTTDYQPTIQCIHDAFNLWITPSSFKKNSITCTYMHTCSYLQLRSSSCENPKHLISKIEVSFLLRLYFLCPWGYQGCRQLFCFVFRTYSHFVSLRSVCICYFNLSSLNICLGALINQSFISSSLLWNNQFVLLTYNTPLQTPQLHLTVTRQVDSGDFSRRSVARAEQKPTSAVFYKMKSDIH